MSNSVFIVETSEDLEPKWFIFWQFENQIIDKNVEHITFSCLSELNIGPKYYFWSIDYRIEEYFDSRGCSVFELWNPVILNKILQSVFHMNFS